MEKARHIALLPEFIYSLAFLGNKFLLIQSCGSRFNGCLKVCNWVTATVGAKDSGVVDVFSAIFTISCQHNIILL
jgi:hypothetical protein